MPYYRMVSVRPGFKHRFRAMTRISAVMQDDYKIFILYRLYHLLDIDG